jgi:hypothetical protein
MTIQTKGKMLMRAATERKAYVTTLPQRRRMMALA